MARYKDKGMRYIDADRLIKTIFPLDCVDKKHYAINAQAVFDAIKNAPTADVVEIETIKAWLYEMAINNVGCVLKGDFSNACEEIISRLDGLRSFAKERTPKERERKE